jgi:hypothetical protein
MSTLRDGVTDPTGIAITGLWLAILAAVPLWAVWCRQRDQGWVRLGDLAAALGRTRSGRFLLVAGWAFVGWHVFARYTVPT